MQQLDWIAKLPLDRGGSAAALRTVNRLEALVDAGSLWLRPKRDSDLPIETVQHVVPFAEFFECRRDGLLRPLGSRLPSEREPTGTWTPIGRAFPVALPAIRPVAASPAAIQLTLVPSDLPRPAAAVLCSLESVRPVVQSLPNRRFAHCRFAAAGQRALICGAPLPPIRGAAHYDDGGILIPAGFRLRPALSASQVRDVMAAAATDVILCGSDKFAILPAQLFVPLSRANLAATIATVEPSSVARPT